MVFGAELPLNTWIELRKDPVGARPGSAIRYAAEARAFFLWGFLNADPNLLQEQPLMQVPEYDVVAFDPDDGRWRGQREKFYPAYIPRTYSGKTTGSEQTVMRGTTNDAGGVPRPDLNIVFDQVAYHPGSQSLIYFTGGLTAAYDVVRRRWRDLAPAGSPPPVVGGSLAYDPVNDQIVLFGGGHAAERAPDGRLVGYTGLWVYRVKANEWRPRPGLAGPLPRMNSRLVTDTKNEALVLFGGDGQSRYLADTWIFDLKTQNWRQSKAAGGPEARAGHFTVYDPQTGWVLVGGGYNQKDLSDMWAYDVREDRWRRLHGEVPTGFYLSADLAPEKRLLVLVTSTRTPGDRMTCNVLYPVRTTYGYRLGDGIVAGDQGSGTGAAMPKLVREQRAGSGKPETVGVVNQWVKLAGQTLTRTWGSATLDNRRDRILYWGGGHCGYEGNDIDAYDIETQTWTSAETGGEYTERLWDHGVRPAGVTFEGGPWTDHGRKTYAYDPVSQKMILAHPIRLTTGYDPEALLLFPARRTMAPDAVVTTPTSYVRYSTWSYDPETRRWELLGPAPAGVDALVTTPRGVMGVNADWPARLNDPGYQLPWNPAKPEDTAIYLFDAGRRVWNRMGDRQTSPQNLYEMTSLAYDSKRDRVILHGGGARRDELWTFDMATRRWAQLQPQGAAPACAREAVYIPKEDVFLSYGPALWAYKVSENAWRQGGAAPPMPAGQNRAMVYDEKRDLVLLVLGAGGDYGKASVYAMRYQK